MGQNQVILRHPKFTFPRANGRASGPVLTSRFLFVPDHNAVVPDAVVKDFVVISVTDGRHFATKKEEICIKQVNDQRPAVRKKKPKAGNGRDDGDDDGEGDDDERKTMLVVGEGIDNG